MFYVDKKASGEHLTHCSKIMDRIVAENPSYWPYGCNPEMFNGGVYLIRKSASHEPVGFTGWQEFDEDGKKVGYYSIGILPEYRQQGFAKEAVAKLINEKSATVDEVRAFIMQHNMPSLELAKTLNVNTLIKSAGALTAKEILGRLAGGLAAAGGTDYMVHGGDYSSFSPSRIGNAVLNTILGASGTHLMASPKAENFMKGLATLGLLPTKDLAFSAVAAMPKVEELINKKLQEQPAVPTPAVSDKDKTILAGLLGAGALGLTGAGFGIAGALNKAQEKRDAGRIQLRLPTRDKNDQETVVDVPLDQANLPPALVSKVMRDTRRKLREETKARTWRRDGRNRLLTNAEPYDDQYEDDEDKLEKAAFAYYRTKLATGNSSSIKPFSIVNTMATSPDQQKMDLEKQKLEMQSKQNESNSAGDSAAPDNSQVLSDLEKSQKELKEANDNLQKQMAAMQHTNDLNREALKNISARTNSIASNLKIAGLLKLAESAGMPNQYRTYDQFVREDMPAAWEGATAVGEKPGWFQNTFLKPDAVREKEYDADWNKNYVKDPKFIGDYVSNAGTRISHGLSRGLNFFTDPVKATFRRAAFGFNQMADAASQPLEKGESWYNPSINRIKGMLGGFGNWMGGSALTGVQIVPGVAGGARLLPGVAKAKPLLGGVAPSWATKAIPFGGVLPFAGGGVGYFMEPDQSKVMPQYYPTDTSTAARGGNYYTPEERNWMHTRYAEESDTGNLGNYLQSLPSYGTRGSGPAAENFARMDLRNRPLGIGEELGLSAATGTVGSMARNQLSQLTGGLAFNDTPQATAGGVTRQNVNSMYTPIQSL